MLARNRLYITILRTVTAIVLVTLPHMCLAGNLLVSPGFEFAGLNKEGTGPWSISSNGWLFEALQAGQDQGIACETAISWAPPKMIHDGSEAIRVYGLNGTGPYHIAISQVVQVAPSAGYEASAWVVARDYGSGGFGEYSTDFAGVVVEELDCAGQVIATHRAGFTDASDAWRQAETSFTTTCYTHSVRFVLDSVFQCVGDVSGHIVYDDCALDGPTSGTATVNGVVTASGAPAVGATVTLGGSSTLTGEGGAYSFENVAVTGAPIQVAATDAYHYPAAKTVVAHEGENSVDLDLPALPATNLLVNGGFEFEESRQGPAPWSASSHGWLIGAPCADQSVGAVSETLNSWGPPAMIHGGSQAMRVFAIDGTGPYRVAISQVVVVGPNVDCTASAWIAARDYGSGGFGETLTDFAGIVIEELNVAGSVIKTHGRVGLTTPGIDWRYVAEKFRTGATTARVRYTLTGVFRCIGNVSGHIIYDDCALEAPVGVGGVSALPEGSEVYLGGQPVTFASDGFFYIEAPDRACGIKVTGEATIGSAVIVRGTIRTVDGERTVVADSVVPSGTLPVPAPLGTSSSAVNDPTATGLYVKMWGRVDSVAAGSFTMTDGGGTSLKIYGSAALHDYVAVTGVLGAEMMDDTVTPVLRSRSVMKLD